MRWLTARQRHIAASHEPNSKSACRFPVNFCDRQLDSGPVASSARADPIQRAQMAVLRGEAPPDAGSTRSAEVDSIGLEVTETFKVTEARLDELRACLMW